MSNRLKKSLVAGFVVIAAPIVAFTAAARPAAQDVEPPPAPVAPLLVFVQAAPVAAPTPAPDPAQAPAPPSAPAPDSAAAPAPPPPPPSAEQAPAQDEIWINVPALNLPQVTVPPVHVKVPRIRLESRLFAGQEDGNWPVFFSSNGDWNLGNWGGYYVGRYDDWSPRFAIVTHDSDSLTMSGDREDAEHARALKQKYSGDFIWFERDGKHYVINDGATVSRAKQLWQPNEDLSKQQQDLGKQMHGLQKQMEDSRQKIEDAKIKLPDMSAEMQKLEETMKQLNASGGTMRDIGDLQRQMGELQRQIGEVEAAAGRDVGAWGRDQGDLGRKMGDIGRQEGELGRKQGQAARDAARQMQQLLDDAVSKGLAKPE